MDGNIFSKVLEAVEDRIKCRNLKIDLSRFMNIYVKDPGNRTAFIDGGQAELLKAADFSLQFVRTAAIIMKNNNKIDYALNEFFVLASAECDEYRTEIFIVKGEGIDSVRINSFDPSVREGNERASVSKIGGIARRFSELKIAEKMVDRLDMGDLIVIDGSLKPMVRGEDRHVDDLIRRGVEKGVIISSLAKTSKMLSEEGACIASQLNSAGDKKEWRYPLDDESRYSVDVVKLNKSSSHVFEFNIAKMQKEHAGHALGALAYNSTDAVFPGYPYGLILSDKIARVSNEEKEYLITRFKAKAGKRWESVEKSLNTLNSHERLDSIY